MRKVGLVLTGGGAHAAYQAGVLRAIAEFSDWGESPFQILTGVSAGAVNAMGLASGATDFKKTAELIWALWHRIKPSNVFRTDLMAVVKTGSGWFKDLSIGGLFGGSHSNALLDTSPLVSLVQRTIQFDQIERNLSSGLLQGVAVTATRYSLGTAVTFFDGDPQVQPWYRGMRRSLRTRIRAPHVLASSAIPIFFPPICLESEYYGDGCVRLNAPLSPAIHLGAERLLAIGTQRSPTEQSPNQLGAAAPTGELAMADLIGVLLNAVFLDSLEFDVDRMQRVNRTVSQLTPEQRARSKDNLRTIPLVHITPSKRLGNFASEEFSRFSPPLRFLLRGLGASDYKGWDLLSYLAFDGNYTRYLLELGYEDAYADRDRILELLKS